MSRSCKTPLVKHHTLYDDISLSAMCMAFVQVPLQNNAEDWKLGNLSCYDATCVARLQTKLNLDFMSIAKGTPRDCLTQKVPSEFEAMLVAETLKADPDALGRLMADHTQVKPWILCVSG